MFAFTPGGTKIVYTRDYLMSLKHSPASMVLSHAITLIVHLIITLDPAKGHGQYSRRHLPNFTTRSRQQDRQCGPATIE